jgi:apolipoprotein N-acyltransferase
VLPLSSGAVIRIALTFCSVFLCALATYPFDFRPAALMAWAPLVVALDGSRARHALGIGLVHGVLLNALGFYWVVPPLQNVAGMSSPGALLAFLVLIVVQGGRTAIIALLHVIGTRLGFPRLVAFPIALVTAELAYPLAFPWYSALFAVAVTSWVQLAEFGGPLLISFWLAIANAGIAEIWLGRMEGRSRMLVSTAIAAAIVLTATAVGEVRLAGLERSIARAPELRIGVAQGGISPAKAEGDSTAVYKRLTHELLRSSTAMDLVVWPESSVAHPVRSTALAQFLRYLPVPERAGTERPSPPVLLGIVLSDDAPRKRAKEEPVLRNAAVLVLPGGRAAGRYDKRSLVPMGETVPGGELPVVGTLLSAVNEFDAGGERQTIELGERRLGLSICYEAILHREILDGVRAARPHLLVNLTSDAWFTESAEPRFHLALASLRAVEHRRFLLRSTTTGITALIDPAGRVVWTLPEGKPAAGVAVARWLDGSTVYGMLGDWPWAALSGGAVAWALVVTERRRKLLRLSRKERASAECPDRDPFDHRSREGMPR